MPANALFFEPWIGRDYAHIREQQEAGAIEFDGWAYPYHVLGESHYGEPHEYEPNLTRSIITKCGYSSTYGKCSAFFAKVLKIVCADEHPELERQEHWAKLAYSNYIQELLPGPGISPTEKMWERGELAFREQLKATRPEVLLVLGERLWKHMPHGDFGFQLPELKSMDGDVSINEARAYVYEVEGVKHLSLAVYVIHPSAGGGAFKWEIAAERARTVALCYSNVAVSDRFEEWPPLRLD